MLNIPMLLSHDFDVILNSGNKFIPLEFKNLNNIKRDLLNNGYKVIFSENDGMFETFERPTANDNPKSIFCIYLYKGKALVQRHD